MMGVFVLGRHSKMLWIHLAQSLWSYMLVPLLCPSKKGIATFPRLCQLIFSSIPKCDNFILKYSINVSDERAFFFCLKICLISNHNSAASWWWTIVAWRVAIGLELMAVHYPYTCLIKTACKKKKLNTFKLTVLETWSYVSIPGQTCVQIMRYELEMNVVFCKRCR